MAETVMGIPMASNITGMSRTAVCLWRTLDEMRCTEGGGDGSEPSPAGRWCERAQEDVRRLQEDMKRVSGLLGDVGVIPLPNSAGVEESLFDVRGEMDDALSILTEHIAAAQSHSIPQEEADKEYAEIERHIQDAIRQWAIW